MKKLIHLICANSFKYLSKMDPQNIYETNLNGPVIYIRHGETNFNHACKEIPKDIANLKPEYIDCCLSEDGEKQAKGLMDVLNSLNVKKVYSSPLLRCLQTCDIALSTHPNKHLFKVKVNYLLNETLSGNHDFSLDIITKKQNFGKETSILYDWNILDSKYNEEEIETFYLSFIDNQLKEDPVIQEIIKNIKLYSNPFQKDKISEQINFLNKYFFENLKKRAETLDHTYIRVKEFKQNLMKDVLDLDLENKEKILVFTHYSNIRLSSSKEVENMFTISDFPSDSYKAKNCEAFTINLI